MSLLAYQFRKDIDNGRLLDPDTYHKIVRACVAAIPDASQTQRVALFCALNLADSLERELEAEAIVAEAEALWHEYARNLEAVLRICGSQTADDETLMVLANAISAIFPPTGHP